MTYTASALEIALAVTCYSGQPYDHRDSIGIGIDDGIIAHTARYLGLPLTYELHKKLWDLLGAFEDIHHNLIHNIAKDENEVPILQPGPVMQTINGYTQFIPGKGPVPCEKPE